MFHISINCRLRRHHPGSNLVGAFLLARLVFSVARCSAEYGRRGWPGGNGCFKCPGFFPLDAFVEGVTRGQLLEQFETFLVEELFLGFVHGVLWLFVFFDGAGSL